MRAASIGECMIEISGNDKAARFGFGGDTLNTAVYLARLGIPTDYVTALGDDPLSQEMSRRGAPRELARTWSRRSPAGNRVCTSFAPVRTVNGASTTGESRRRHASCSNRPEHPDCAKPCWAMT